jgi:hypothetical protein
MNRPFRVTRVPVGPEPRLGGRAYDYADSFAVHLDEPDAHSAEEWVRTAIEQAPAALGALVVYVHRDLIRFRLGPISDAEHIIGWQIVHSSPDVFQMQAGGPLVDAVIVARRDSPTRAKLTTFLFYRHRSVRLLWLVIRPLHLTVARHLLQQAATTFTASSDRTVRMAR